jgi:choice-of-anchor A domain-containing protein
MPRSRLKFFSPSADSYTDYLLNPWRIGENISGKSGLSKMRSVIKTTLRGYSLQCLIVGAVLLSVPELVPASTLLGVASSYNAFVFGDFTEYSTDSQGALAIGGNFAPSSGSFTIASTHAGDNASIYDFVVAGNAADNYASLGGGSAFIGGNLTWNDPTLPKNVYVNGSFSNPSNGGSVGGTIYYAGTYSSGLSLSHSKLTSPVQDPIDFASARTNLLNVSNTLAMQSANGTVSSAYNTYSLNGTNSSANIFFLAGSSYNNSTFNISAPAGSTVIINVAGMSDSFSGGSMNLTGVSADHVIWNFSNAASVAISSIAFDGTLLAPGASFVGSWGQLNGQLIANSAAGTTELHDVLFDGSLPSSQTSSNSQTPEPSTWMLSLTGVGLIAFSRRRLYRRQSTGRT